jgi:GntR family transcriptional repressor for pyruvate dehydrogenase complex
LTATEAVSKHLIEMINSGTWSPGDRLPPERKLAEQLGVGRTTVREALKLLTLSGFLRARRGSGTYVRDEYSSLLTHQMEWPALLGKKEVDQLLEVREALETQTARLAAQRATSEDIDMIASLAEMIDKEDREPEKWADIDFRFHLAIAAASKNPLFVQLLTSLEDLLKEYVVLANVAAEDMKTTANEHRRVASAIKSGNPDKAAQAMARHLVLSRLWVERTLSQLATTREENRAPGQARAG